MKLKRMTLTTRYVLTIGILLLVVNTVLGIVIFSESKTAMKKLVSKNMLDVVKSAAATIDGDVLGSIAKEDEGGTEFTKIAKQLTVFSDSVDIEYIYAVKQAGKDKFVFTIDPDPVDPGEYGEAVLVTDALRKAGKGIAAADNEPAADEWGNFYSAYCPVYNSAHKIAGIIGIDYAAKWYEDQISKYSVTITVFTVLSVLFGSFFVFLITHRVRRRFSELDDELSAISSGVDTLMGELANYSGFDINDHDNERDDRSYKELKNEEKAVDEIEKLTEKMHAMQSDMGRYLDYLHKQAFTDALTMVSNASAYHGKIEELDNKAASGKAAYTIIAFDLNSLKELNDELGHECGDKYLSGAAAALSEVFGTNDTYRIGGDEFAVIIENADEQALEDDLNKLRAILGRFRNSENNPYDKVLSLATGHAAFDPVKDSCFADVFSRADKMMYKDKKAYYEKHDRRR